MDKSQQELERREILRRYRRLIEVWQTRKDTIDRWMVRKAFRLAADAHKDMRRKTGEPFIYHPLEVATIAAGEIGLGRTAIISALLHDTVEDTEITLNDVRAMFGDEVTKIIDGLTKIDEISGNTTTAQAETLKKILYTLSEDVRVILVKLADRLHNMRTLGVMKHESQLKIASETLYIYAPLAYRLGLFAIKSELEELSFKYSQPVVYKEVYYKLLHLHEKQVNYFEEFKQPILERVSVQYPEFIISYNEKTAYSIWQKMKVEEIPFEEIYNTYSVDIIVDTEPENERLACWGVYSVVTSIYKPNNKRLHDWISTPKANGYEAIHTTVMGNKGTWVDVHIRSKRMDEIAKRGYAAYWKYKNRETLDAGLDDWLGKTRELLTESDEEALAFIDDFKKQLFSEEIVVFTPEGKMVSLASGATVLDFAYAIHTDIGNHCIGANVNHRLVPIHFQLKAGDQAEVIISKIQQPNEDWYNYVVTARAKSRIKNAIKNDRKKYRDEGAEKLGNYFDQLKLENSKPNINKLIKAKNLKGRVDLYYYLAKEDIGFKDVKDIFHPQESLVSWMRNLRFPFVRPKTVAIEASAQVGDVDTDVLMPNNSKSGEFNELEYSVSKCCNPIPGDDVIGLIFPNEPIQIHKTNCNVAIKLMAKYGKNIVKAKWKQKEGITFLAGIKIKAVDKIGFIVQISKMISEEFNLNIRSFNLESVEGLIDLNVTLYVNSTDSLNKLIQKLKKTEEVIKVARLDKIL